MSISKIKSAFCFVVVFLLSPTPFSPDRLFPSSLVSQRALLAVLFELLGREMPDTNKPPETLVAEYLDAGIQTESTKLYEGFVAEEARLFLPHLGDTR